MKQENIKIVNIRDRATYIPALIIKMLPENEEEKSIFRDIGYIKYRSPCILLISLQKPWISARSSDEWENVGRTFPIAHRWIEKNFDSVSQYQLIDVEFLEGEVESPCLSARDEINI